MKIQITKKTIFSLIINFAFISILGAQYLQEGLYPECSYVIVDEQGWKIHKNQDGKTISMTSKDKHNTKTGKYSFDKFGNLVPFKECVTDDILIENTDSSSDISIDIDIQLSILKNIKYSVFGGISVPFGDNIDSYEMGPLAGLEVRFKNLNFSLSSSSLEYESEINGDGDNIFYRKNSLTSFDLYFGYILKYKNLYVTPKIALLNRTYEASGAGLNSINNSGMDVGIGGEIGYDFGKFSLYGAGNFSTTFYETEQTATFYNFGLKYNF
tara:strand:+ start:3480 stop:4286 length:807 start_codon:yes stop_codon:yes gene_type:complete